MHNASFHHLLTDARAPFPKPYWLLFWVTPPILYTGHDIWWCGISLRSVQVTCPRCVPSQFVFLHTASLAEHKTKKIKSLTSYKHHLANVVNTVLIPNPKHSIATITAKKLTPS